MAFRLKTILAAVALAMFSSTIAAPPPSQPALILTPDQIRSLISAHGDTQMHLLQSGIGEGSTHNWLVKKVSVYTRNPSIKVIDSGRVSMIAPSSRLFFTLTDASDYRWSIGLSKDGRQLTHAVLVGPDGVRSSEITKMQDGNVLVESTPLIQSGPNGEPIIHDFSGELGLPYIRGNEAGLTGPLIPKLGRNSISKGSALLEAVVAVDTDVELLSDKFSNNTTNANDYIAGLFAAMNTVYEGELDLHLSIGDLTIRTGSAGSDPWSQGPDVNGSAQQSQLVEFGNWWQSNKTGVNRAFAMLLSGKQPTDNSASGIAWVLDSGNYCSSKSGSGGHYSINQVFKYTFNGGFMGTIDNDVGIVAHELGHNLGSLHTHCSNAQQALVDNCFNGEGSGGGVTCFTGSIQCPATNGGKGTLMSYCHTLNDGMGNGGANCGSNVYIFSPNRQLFLAGRIAANSPSCLMLLGGGPNDIFANGFE